MNEGMKTSLQSLVKENPEDQTKNLRNPRQEETNHYSNEIENP